MCGRFTLRVPSQRLVQQFLLDVAPDLPPRFNIAPTQDVAAVRIDPNSGARRLDFLRWGLIPSWTKDLAAARGMINARAETVAEKPTFRAPFKRRRCLIPADGYYEWQAGPHHKQPFHIHLPKDGLFAFAGLWDSWRAKDEPPEATPLETCALLTTDANPNLAAIHDRMPVIIEPADYALWLDPSVQDPAKLAHLLRPCETEFLADPVSTHVNNPRHEDEDCLLPQA